MKTCYRCHQLKPLDAFHRANNAKPSAKGRAPYCKQCRSEMRSSPEGRAESLRGYYRNREKRIEQHHWYLLKKEYGIVEEQFNDLLTKQNGVCAICKQNRSSSRTKRLFVDHCHITGKVRGLLCHKCNYLIGYAEDNAEILKKAIKYINQY